MTFQNGEVVDGKYRVIERLGAGGMGEVYKVEHVYLHAVRVIKVIRAQISESLDAHDRFLREAQLATKVQHPNVATLHDFSALADGLHYMVWEFIEGENLAQVLRRRGAIAPQEATRLTLQTLAGLDAIHRAGIIHRDISPENLMITNDGNVKIIDLGVAKAQYGDYATTQTGMFVGKLRYSSPEQLGFLQAEEKLDARADLYSLGVVLFEMLTGRPPFEATSPHQYFLRASGATKVEPIDLSIVPDPLRPVLAKALERDRDRRFANANEFAKALQNVTFPAAGATTVRTQIISTPSKPRDSQNAIVILLIVILLAIGAGATWFYRSRGGPLPQPASKPQQPASKPPEKVPQPATASIEVAPRPEPVPAVQPRVEARARARRKAPEAAKSAEGGGPTALQPPAPPEPQPQIATYIDGASSSDNDAALAFAQERLRGVHRVALDTTESQLSSLVHDLNLTIADDSNVTIHFTGSITRMRFGRKRREGQGTITKNGRTIFRYRLKPEDYRVGDTPAEAFARVLSDVFGR